MATFEIKMPKLGESITEGTIITWSVKVGDTVEEDDVLFEVSTAKVSAEIPSPVEGKVKQLLFNEGDTVAVGTVVAILEIEGEGEDNGAQPETSEATQPKEQVPAPASEELSKNSQEEDRWYSPVVLQLAKAAGVSQDELDHIPGTGYLGRLSKKDIQTYIDHKNKGTEMPKPKQAPVSSMQQTATSTPIITVAPPTAPSMPMIAMSYSIYINYNYLNTKIRSSNGANCFSPGSCVEVPNGISAISFQFGLICHCLATASSINGL